MPSLPVNTSVSVGLPAGSSINITGNGAWAFIATVSGREIASGSYVGPDVIGPFTRAAVVGLTATVSDGLQYTVADFVEGNSAASVLTTEQVTALQSVVSGYGNAPATLNASTAAAYNGATLSLAAAATLTVHDGAWDLLSAGIVIQVGQGGSATLAFSGTATKENASGTSATSVTLAASGVYALTQSPSGSPKFRLSGGASL